MVWKWLGRRARRKQGEQVLRDPCKRPRKSLNACDGSRGGRSGNAGDVGAVTAAGPGAWLGLEGQYKGSQTKNALVLGWRNGVFVVLLMSESQRCPKMDLFVENCPTSELSASRSMEPGPDLQPLPGLQGGREGVEREGAGLLVGAAIPLEVCVLSLGL